MSSKRNLDFILQLPPELLEHIIAYLAGSIRNHKRDEVFNEAITDLRNLQLVCQAFTPIVRPYLFRHIYATIRPKAHPDDPILKLVGILSHDSQISRSVRTLSLTFSRNNWDDHEDTLMDYEEDSILPLFQLSEIDTLEIWVSSFNSYTGASSTEGLTFRRVLDHYTSSGTLTELSLHNINGLPINTLLSSPPLKSLSLFACRLADWNPDATREPPSYRLQELTYKNCDNLPFSLFTHLLLLKFLSTNKKLWESSEIQSHTISLHWPFRALETLQLFADLPWVSSYQSLARQHAVRPFPSLRKVECMRLTALNTANELLESVSSIESISMLCGPNAQNTASFPRPENLRKIRRLSIFPPSSFVFFTTPTSRNLFPELNGILTEVGRQNSLESIALATRQFNDNSLDILYAHLEKMYRIIQDDSLNFHRLSHISITIYLSPPPISVDRDNPLAEQACQRLKRLFSDIDGHRDTKICINIGWGTEDLP